MNRMKVRRVYDTVENQCSGSESWQKGWEGVLLDGVLVSTGNLVFWYTTKASGIAIC